MTADLRRRLLACFASGTPEELSVLPALIHQLALHPKNSTAVVDFHVHSGCCEYSDE